MSRMMTTIGQMQEQMKRMDDDMAGMKSIGPMPGHMDHMMGMMGQMNGMMQERHAQMQKGCPGMEINYLLARMTVDSVMTTAVVTVDPRRDARGASQLMLDHKIGALPVVDGGTVIGIITETDLLRAFVKAS